MTIKMHPDDRSHALRGDRLIVPTRSKGMQPGTLRVPQVRRLHTRFVIDTNHLWERACPRRRQPPQRLTRACQKSPLLRQLQIIHRPTHHQLANHDQLRNPQQRRALRCRYEIGKVIDDGSAAGRCSGR